MTLVAAPYALVPLWALLCAPWTPLAINAQPILAPILSEVQNAFTTVANATEQALSATQQAATQAACEVSPQPLPSDRLCQVLGSLPPDAQCRTLGFLEKAVSNEGRECRRPERAQQQPPPTAGINGKENH